jgi:hypothetical protein
MTLEKPYYYIDGDLGIYLHIIDKDNPNNSLEIRGDAAKQEYLLLSSLLLLKVTSLENHIKNLLNNEYYRQLETEFNASLGTAIGNDIEFSVLEAKEVNQTELAFQSLLKEYNLTDNAKTRKLWYKCYEQGHSSGLEEQINWFHELVDLIKED